MTRRRRSTLRRWWDRIAKGLRYWTEPGHARRVDGAKKAARTRRQNAEDLRATETLERMERGRIFDTDPTP